MARYEHLPIYKQAMDVAVRFEKVVAGLLQSFVRVIGQAERQRRHGSLLREQSARAPHAQPRQTQFDRREVARVERCC